MTLITETVCTLMGLSLMVTRTVLLIAIAPRWLDQMIPDPRLQTIPVSISFTVLLYSSTLLQSFELTLMNTSDVALAWRRLCARFGPGTSRWHRDLVFLNLLSGLFGAGVAANLQIVADLSVRQARLTSILAALAIWAGIVLIHRGTSRFRLNPPSAGDSR